MAAPIALFCYKRLDHLKKVVDALKKNTLSSSSDLFVFSDGARSEIELQNINAIREYIKTIKGFKSIEIVERKENLGLARSIKKGITEVLRFFDKIIAIEDDILVSQYFLQFINDALDIYANDEAVWGAAGYLYPIKAKINETVLLRMTSAWGFGIFKRAWNKISFNPKELLEMIEKKSLQNNLDFNDSIGFSGMLKNQVNNRIDSWAICLEVSSFLQESLFLYPKKSLVANIGHDGTGTHCKRKTSIFDCEIYQNLIIVKKNDIQENLKIRKKIELFFKRKIKQEPRFLIFQKIRKKIKIWLLARIFLSYFLVKSLF